MAGWSLAGSARSERGGCGWCWAAWVIVLFFVVYSRVEALCGRHAQHLLCVLSRGAIPAPCVPSCGANKMCVELLCQQHVRLLCQQHVCVPYVRAAMLTRCASNCYANNMCVRIAMPTTCVRAVCSSCDANKMCVELLCQQHVCVCSAVFSAIVMLFVLQLSLRCSWGCLFRSFLCDRDVVCSAVVSAL